jgi:hypothetical protein
MVVKKISYDGRTAFVGATIDRWFEIAENYTYFSSKAVECMVNRPQKITKNLCYHVGNIVDIFESIQIEISNK